MSISPEAVVPYLGALSSSSTSGVEICVGNHFESEIMAIMYHCETKAFGMAHLCRSFGFLYSMDWGSLLSPYPSSAPTESSLICLEGPDGPGVGPGVLVVSGVVLATFFVTSFST